MTILDRIYYVCDTPCVYQCVFVLNIFLLWRWLGNNVFDFNSGTLVVNYFIFDIQLNNARMTFPFTCVVVVHVVAFAVYQSIC